jgi:hypothetical protein
MARPAPRRGLQNMRTQSSRKAVASLQSPELYLRLTSLEMERSRRILEKDRLVERIAILDERISEIATEQEEMRQRISERDRAITMSSKPIVTVQSTRSTTRGLTY